MIDGVIIDTSTKHTVGRTRTPKTEKPARA
jgi:hypothetical protein